MHWPSGLRALTEALRCVGFFFYSLSKSNTVLQFFFFFFNWLLWFLSLCLPWKNLVLFESSQVSRSCWWFWFLWEHLKSEGVSLKLKNLRGGCENKDDVQKERKALQDCSCWIWKSCRKLWMAKLCRKLWGKQTLPCLHVLMDQGHKPLFSLRFLSSVAWFDYRVLYLWGGDTTVQQHCVSIVFCSTCCRTLSFINRFQVMLVIPTPPPLCCQVTKKHYLKAFSSLRSVSTTVSVCEGLLNGTKGQMYRSVQRNICKLCT